MSRKFALPVLLIFVLVSSGCNLTAGATPTTQPTTPIALPTTATNTRVATDTATATAVRLPTNTPLSPTATLAATATLAFTATPSVIPTLTPTATEAFVVPTPVAPVSNPASGNYVDDRTTPAQVMVSFYNAINRQEYLRAYSYWNDPADTLGSLSTFSGGYATTASVELVFGQIMAGAGAGQIYYTVPVLLKATDNNGVHTNFGACYVVHQSQPSFYGAPPFDPMGIASGSANQVDSSASQASVLAEACSGSPNGGMPVAVEGSSLDISKDNFLDNRSGPLETVSSMLNAINLKQYVRAYFYFQDPTHYPGPYNEYEAGFSDTEVITATFGTATSEGAAGSIYYKQPLGMEVLTTTGAKQYFVGCYTLRLSQPAVQGTPPFIPLGITAGTFKKVNNNSDIIVGLPTACK